MKHLYLLGIFLNLCTPICSAQGVIEIQTNAGLVKVQGGSVTVGDNTVYQNDNVSIHDFSDAGILIHGQHGGRHCPDSYHLLNKESGELQILNPNADRDTLFGECRRLIKVIPEVMLVVMAPVSPNEQAYIFAWNGNTMVESVIERSFEQVGELTTGEVLKQWEGKYLFELLKSTEERMRLLSIMSEEELKWFSYWVLRGSLIGELNGYIVGSGCDPDLCNANWGVLAIRILDGAPFVLMPDDVLRTPEGESMPSIVFEEARTLH